MVLASRPQAAGLTKDMHETARRLNTTLLPITLVKTADEVETFFARARRDGVGAVIAPNDGVTNLHRPHVVAAAARHGIPTIYSQREFVDAGGLMAYGPSFIELFRRAPTFVDKILKGAKPANLPMEQPTKFELVLNLKTATALGLAMPPMLLARADAIVE
jgi:putative ABC transport system substrate-binding protein